MKIKSNFVTNSSSCSFIMVGWQFTQQEHNKLKKLKPQDYIQKLHEYDGTEDGAETDDHILIGREIIEVEEWGLDFGTIKISDLLEDELLVEFKKTFNIKKPPQVFFSTRTC